MSTPGSYFITLTIARVQEIERKDLNNARKIYGEELLRQKRREFCSEVLQS